VALLLIAGVDGATIAHRAEASHPRPVAQHASSTRAAIEDASSAVDALLRERADDVRRRDLAAFTALLDPTATSFVTAQRAEFVALAQLPLTDVGYTADTASATTRGQLTRYGTTPTYAPTVTFSYEIDGFDSSPVTATEVDTFVLRDGAWLFASDSDFGPPSPQIWQQGPLYVVRGRSSLVIAQQQTAAQAQAVADEVDRDVPTVTATWGTDWPQRAVVLLPATSTELGALVGESGDLSQIAAVESSEVGGDELSGARIAINPAPYASLSALGRQVVITHELTHVASRAFTTTSSPLWLVEGLADYVGFSTADLPVPIVAAELQTRLRSGFAPTALPTDLDFRSDAANLASTYEQAWLACRLIASKVGPAGLVAFYRSVGSSGLAPADAVGRALRAQLHESTAQFTAAWIAYVDQQLR
jgi:hypothetical protein